MKWQKKFSFHRTDKGWISDLLNQRDEATFPTESEYVRFILRSFEGEGRDEGIKQIQEVEERQLQKEFAWICPKEERVNIMDSRSPIKLVGSEYLDKVGRYFVCLKYQQRTGKTKFFKVDNKPMTLDEVKRICKRCKIPWADRINSS